VESKESDEALGKDNTEQNLAIDKVLTLGEHQEAMLAHLGKRLVESLEAGVRMSSEHPIALVDLAERTTIGVSWALATQREFHEDGVWSEPNGTVSSGSVARVLHGVEQVVKNYIGDMMLSGKYAAELGTIVSLSKEHKSSRSIVAEEDLAIGIPPAGFAQQNQATLPAVSTCVVSPAGQFPKSDPFATAMSSPDSHNMVNSSLVEIQMERVARDHAPNAEVGAEEIRIACLICRNLGLKSRWKRIFADGKCAVCMCDTGTLMLAPCKHASVCTLCLEHLPPECVFDTPNPSSEDPTLGQGSSLQIRDTDEEIRASLSELLGAQDITDVAQVTGLVEFILAIEDTVRCTLLHEATTDLDAFRGGSLFRTQCVPSQLGRSSESGCSADLIGCLGIRSDELIGYSGFRSCVPSGEVVGDTAGRSCSFPWESGMGNAKDTETYYSAWSKREGIQNEEIPNEEIPNEDIPVEGGRKPPDMPSYVDTISEPTPRYALTYDLSFSHGKR